MESHKYILETHYPTGEKDAEFISENRIELHDGDGRVRARCFAVLDFLD